MLKMNGRLESIWKLSRNKHAEICKIYIKHNDVITTI
jgi:hypothetical protein